MTKRNKQIGEHERHRLRHVELHRYFDELLADYLVMTGCQRLPSEASITDLMKWSHQQTIDPQEMPAFPKLIPKPIRRTDPEDAPRT